MYQIDRILYFALFVCMYALNTYNVNTNQIPTRVFSFIDINIYRNLKSHKEILLILCGHRNNTFYVLVENVLFLYLICMYVFEQVYTYVSTIR